MYSKMHHSHVTTAQGGTRAETGERKLVIFVMPPGLERIRNLGRSLAYSLSVTESEEADEGTEFCDRDNRAKTKASHKGTETSDGSTGHGPQEGTELRGGFGLLHCVELARF